MASTGISVKQLGTCKRGVGVSTPTLVRNTRRAMSTITCCLKEKLPLNFKKLLGHENINNTLLYTQLVNFESDEFHIRVAKTFKEARELMEAALSILQSWIATKFSVSVSEV